MNEKDQSSYSEYQVRSPFQAILDYELDLGIPPGWVNHSISKTAPNGAWHKLERGDISLDAGFFRGFNEDLHDQDRWREFYRREQAKNPRLPREIPPLPIIDGELLFNEMMYAGGQPDPWMFPALEKLRESGDYILAALSNTVIFPKGHELYLENFFDDPVRRVFDIFISSAHVGMRKPDPKIYQFTMQQVDKFARRNALSQRGRRLGWRGGIQPEDVIFLDDIGENLKAARQAGFGTIKVPLGRAYEAVEQLERITGLRLEGNHPKIPVKPNYRTIRAKI